MFAHAPRGRGGAAPGVVVLLAVGPGHLAGAVDDRLRHDPRRRRPLRRRDRGRCGARCPDRGPRAERTRSWWGWGWEDAALAAAEADGLARTMAPFGFTPEEHDPPAVADLDLRAPRVAAARRARADLLDRARATGPGTRYGKSYRDVVRGLLGELDRAARRGRPPRDRGRRRRRARLVRATRASPPSPTAAARRWSAASRRRWATATPARVSIDLDRGSTGCSRSTHVSRAARIQGGALGPVARGPAPPARLHAAPLPAVVRVLDARRLAGHPVRRPLRHACYTHIDDLVESMRVVTPVGRQRVAAAAGLGRRAVARPAVPRLARARSASSPRRGCACRTGPRWQGSAASCASPTCDDGVDAVRAVAQSGLLPDQLPAARRGRGGPGRGRRRRRRRCWCSASSRPTTRSTRGSTAAVELCRDHGGESPTGSGAPTPTPTRPRRPGGRGGRVAHVVPAGAVPARRAGARMGVIVETFETACTWDRVRRRSTPPSRRRRRPRSSEVCGGGGRHVPVHPRLPRRPGALLHGLRAGPAGVPSSRSGTRSRRPRPRRCSPTAAPSPTTTPSGATTGPGTTASAPTLFAAALRRRQGRARPRRHPQPRRADRPLTTRTSSA